MWERRFARAILRHRVAVVAAVAALSIVAAFFASGVRMDSSIEIWFLEDDPTLVSYREFLDRFGGDEFVVLGVFAPEVYSPRVLRAVDRLTEAGRRAPFAKRVTSLTSVKIFEAVDGGVEVTPLVRELPRTAAQAEAIRARATANTWIGGNLVSRNGRATAVLVEMDPKGNNFEGKTELVTALRDAARQVAGEGVEIRLAGSPVFDEAFFRYTNRDFSLLGPVSLFVVFAIVTFVFRRPTAVIVPLSIVLIAILWTFGLMGALGIDVNLVTTMLTALILAVGVADSIHILADYYRQLASGKDRDAAVEESLAHLLVPCFFTSATTAVGLLSLLASDLRPTQEFGWLAAVGVGLAFLLSVTFVPAILSMARPPSEAFLERQRSGPLNRLLERLGRPTLASSRAVLAGTAVLVLLLAGGAALLEVGSNPINYFRKNDPIRQDFAAIDEALGGGWAVEFLVTAPNRGLLDPVNLERLSRFERWMSTRPGYGRSISILDGLREVNRVMHDGDPAAAVLPDSRDLAAQYYLLMEGEEDFDAFIQDDYSIGRITVRVSTTRSGEAVEQMPAIEARLSGEVDGPGLDVEPTGFLKLMGEMETYIVDSQIRSLTIAFVAITLMMALLLKSLRLGLFSMIPNLTPIAAGLGFMGLVGIPLDPGTVMIASIALGLVVDDSVHFLHRLRLNVAGGLRLEDAIFRTMTETGRAIIMTSVVLAAGFSILGLGSFSPNIYFGVVTAAVVLLALVADLMVLPAALLIMRPAFPDRRD